MTEPSLHDGWKTLTEGDELPEVALEVTEQTVILVPVATWDLFPGHHSPAYARAQGQQDMYLNTAALQGVVDRAITDALGPRTWVVRRRLNMLGSVYPGDTLRGAATVLAVRRSAPTTSTVGATQAAVAATSPVEADFSIDMATRRGPVLRAAITACRYYKEGTS